MSTREPTKGYRQLHAIIDEIMCFQQSGCDGLGWPEFTFMNGVLTCEPLLGKSRLWFHWGQLLIVRDGQGEGTKSGECEELDEWNTAENGTIELIGVPQTEVPQ